MGAGSFEWAVGACERGFHRDVNSFDLRHSSSAGWTWTGSSSRAANHHGLLLEVQAKKKKQTMRFKKKRELAVQRMHVYLPFIEINKQNISNAVCNWLLHFK